ncbi:hypothetical protein AB0M39_40150 [Streptomyces sp. NPDC051907]|uniref:hypothetical protein n=1 Tax=Streptomyces sp. NPDC051907 TaxID=3155284 RepID=UPI003430F4EB
MNPRWPRLLRRLPRVTTRDRRIEDRLLDGDHITLRLADELAVRVSLDGVAMIVSHEHRMPEEQARSLLLAARYASTFPGQPASSAPEDHEGVRTIAVQLSPRQNQHVGDVLAAYFRLNSQD